MGFWFFQHSKRNQNDIKCKSWGKYRNDLKINADFCR